MNYVVKFRRWGNSYGITIPRSLRHKLALVPGEVLVLRARGDKIDITRLNDIVAKRDKD